MGGLLYQPSPAIALYGVSGAVLRVDYLFWLMSASSVKVVLAVREIVIVSGQSVVSAATNVVCDAAAVPDGLTSGVAVAGGVLRVAWVAMRNECYLNLTARI